MDGKPLFGRSARAVVSAVEQEGLSRRQAAARFGVGIKTAIDWVRQFRETGRLSALPMGGKRPKKLVGKHRDWLLQRCQGWWPSWPNGA